MKDLEITENYENVNWEEVIPVLMAFADSQKKLYNWSRGIKSPLPKGKESYDLAIQTILTYLETPDKFDPSRNKDLIKYLKYHILRQLVFNLAKSKENAKHLNSEKSTQAFISLLTEDAKLDSKIDMEKVVSLIRKEIEEDLMLSEIFINLYDFESTRKETYTELDISPKDYDNHVRRLRRIISKILKDNNNG
jgi:hypothetical protein